MTDLTTINGIGPKSAQLLAAGGVNTLAALAASTPEALDAIVQAPDWRKPDYAGWISQAQGIVGAPPTPAQTEMQDLIAELNDLAQDLQKLVPDYSPPAFSAQRLVSLLRDNLDRFTPDVQKGLVSDLQALVADTPPEEFLNIETWKGLWFTLNYLAQQEAGERKDKLTGRLKSLPGISTMAGLREMLADTPPEEFLKVDTWKGMWFIVNYEMQNQAQGLKRRLLGSDEE